MTLPDDVTALIRNKGLGFVSTVMPNGSPQVTEVWVDSDGEHLLINTVVGHQKQRNVSRDPRVAVAVADPAQPSRYRQLRGTVIEQRTEGAVDHIEELSQRYNGEPYGWWGGRDQQRIILVIEVDKISGTR